MFGVWAGAAKWAKEADRKRKERAEQRKSFGRKRLRRHQAGSPELRHVRLTEDEKRKLRAKIIERAPKTAHTSMMSMTIYFYMGIMIFGVAGTGIIIVVHKDIDFPNDATVEAAHNMLSCLIVIAFGVLWLKLSSMRKNRGLLATIPGIIFFVSGSGLIGFGVVSMHQENVIVFLLPGAVALVMSYLLCFSKGENTGS